MNTNSQLIGLDLLSMNVMMMIMLLIMMMMMMGGGVGGVPCYAYKQAPHWIGYEELGELDRCI